MPTVRGEFAAQWPNLYWMSLPETILLRQHFQGVAANCAVARAGQFADGFSARPIAGWKLHLLDIKGVLGRISTGALLLNK